MTSPASTIAVAVGAVLFAASAQPAPLSGFSLVAETEHFSYFAKGKQKIDFEKTERFLAKVEGLLGHTVKGRTEFYRHADSNELGRYTGRYDAGGVTNLRTGRIHSVLPYHPHEIVHRVAGEMGGDPGVFFHEGLAVALSADGQWFGQDIDRLAKVAVERFGFRAFSDTFQRFEMDTAYPVAGSFVSFLIEKHGIAKVAFLFRACGNGGDDRDAVFARLFGRTLAEAGAEWAASL